MPKFYGNSNVQSRYRIYLLVNFGKTLEFNTFFCYTYIDANFHCGVAFMKLICFDIGDKRIGVATSDPFMSMALPQKTYWRKNFKKDIEYLIELAKSVGATRIVCGLPVNFDGSPSVQTDITSSFIAALKEATDIEVVTNDERFTTKLATRDLISANVRREDRKNYVDSIAASYILEDYINKLKNQEN